LLDSNLVPTGEVTRSALFDRAEERFNLAITVANTLPAGAARSDLLDMARVGLARTLLNDGDKAGAAAVAALVTPDFVKYATASTTFTRRENRVVRENNVSNSSSIGPEYRNFLHM